MNTVTSSHFSRMCQVSREAIRKAIAADKVKTVEEGGKKVVDLDHRVTQEYLRSKNPAHGKPTAEPKPAPPPKPKKQPAKKKTPPPADPLEITAPEVPDNTPPHVVARSIDEVDGSNIAYIDKTDLQKFKIYEDTLKIKQEREYKRGKLIDRDIIKTLFGKLYTVDTNELKALEERLTPQICSIIKISDGSPESFEIRKLLNEEITSSLRHIQRIMDDFLKSKRE